MFRWIASLVFVCAATTASAFSLGSRHALVIDAQSGEVLLEKSPDAVVPIASLTKLMTAMVLLDAEPDMDENIRYRNWTGGAGIPSDRESDRLHAASGRVARILPG